MLLLPIELIMKPGKLHKIKLHKCSYSLSLTLSISLLLTHCFGSLYLVFPARAPSENLTEVEILLGIEPGEGRSAGQQAGFQLALLTSTLVLAIVGGLLTGQSYFNS